MTRSVFYAFGAFVGSITGPTTCAWWPDDPVTLKWDPNRLIPIDLGKNPQAARSGQLPVADIQADDYAGYTFGGFTRIGPMWPGGVMNGIVWIDSGFWSKLPSAIQPPRITGGLQCRDYELTMVLYWDGPLAQRRFQGLYAEIGSVQGTNALVTVWQAGSSLVPGQNPLGTWWLDLAAVAHPIEQGFTEIGVGPNDPKKGALFLDVTQRSVVPFACPKLPRYLGGVVPARSRDR